MPHGDFVARHRQVSHDQVQFWIARDHICLEIPRVLKTFRQRAANQRDVVILLEGEFGLRFDLPATEGQQVK